MDSESSTGHPTHPRSVLIADVVSSTALYEQLGDRRARSLIAGGVKSMCDEVERAGGWVVKSMGDGILTSYDTDNVVESALRMMEAMEVHGLEITIGIHYGDVMEVDQDIFGDVVNTAARIAGIARESEILISKPMWERCTPEIQDKARSVPPVSVKGKRDPLELFSILEFDDTNIECDMTMASAGEETALRDREIKLEYDGQTFELSGEGTLQMGRGAKCEIIVRQSEASRIHAKIFYRRPDYVLADSSTNGTFLVPEFGSQAHILRRETVLFGRGKIYPGANPKAAAPHSISFEVT